jgi:hypothetical protein
MAFLLFWCGDLADESISYCFPSFLPSTVLVDFVGTRLAPESNILLLLRVVPREKEIFDRKNLEKLDFFFFFV